MCLLYEHLKILSLIENPAVSEIHGVIHFLSAKGVKVAETNREISVVYEENIIADGIIWKWVTAFMNIHDVEQTVNHY